jgi:hypothetical protein
MQRRGKAAQADRQQGLGVRGFVVVIVAAHFEWCFLFL